jgi:DNA-binding response OmpR family regulator
MHAVPAIRRILIVDDEPRIAETLQMILSRRGYEVRVADAAEQALELLPAWKPDVAIVDVMLPQMNGIDFGIIVRTNYADCRVLLLSGHPETVGLLEDARRKGHDFEILAKPLHPTLILDIVSNLLSAAPVPAQA